MSDDATLDKFAVDSEESNESDMCVESKQTTDDLQTLETSPIESWELLRLGDVLSFEYGDNLPEDTRQDGEIPVYGSNGQVDTHTEANVDRAGIIIGRKGSIGEGEFSNEPFWAIDTTYYISREETNENLRFIHYLLQDMELERLNAASAIPGLNRNDAYNLNTLIPTVSEQRKIATVLDTVDKAIDKTESIIKRISKTKQGVKQDILRDGISSENKKSTPIGDLPDSWGVATVTDVCEVNPEGFSKEDIHGENFDYISLSDVSEGNIIKSQSIPTEEAPSRAQRTIRTGDVLVGTVRPKQRSHSVVTEEYDSMVCSSGFGVLRPSNKLKSEFLAQEIFSRRFFRQMEAYVAGSGYPAVKIGDLKKIRLPIPPIEVQREIANILRSIDKARFKQEKYNSQLQHFKKGLMQDFLSGDVRTTDASIEIPEEVAKYG
jgi:type I restriction enzyme S subunit